MKRGFITVILLFIVINCVQAIFSKSDNKFIASNHLYSESQIIHKEDNLFNRRSLEQKEVTQQLRKQNDTEDHKLHKSHKNPHLVTKSFGEKVNKQQLNSFSFEPNISINKLLLPAELSRLRETPITHIMLHFISNGSVNPQNPYDLDEVYHIFTDYGLSTHYLIDRTGNIYQLVEDDRVAYHAGKGSITNFPQYKDRLNDYSIGIEMMAIGTKEEMESMIAPHIYETIDVEQIGYKEEQYESLNLLLNDLMERHPTIINDRDHIIGHDEYAPNRKTDPGSLFDWTKIGF